MCDIIGLHIQIEPESGVYSIMWSNHNNWTKGFYNNKNYSNNNTIFE